jgi:hypothetical protein
MALLASSFVIYVIGDYANLGVDALNYNFPILIIFGVEVVTISLWMVVTLFVIYTKVLKIFLLYSQVRWMIYACSGL